MFDDPLSLLPLEVLREQLPALVRESCAWAVGLSDRPHAARRHGRAVPTGVSLGVRAAAGQPMASDEDGRVELGDARPGTFRDALNALTPTGELWADRYEAEVLRPFVDDVCMAAAVRARDEEPEAWLELLDDLGEDGDDPLAVARGAEWDSGLRGAAEDLALAALGDLPLVEVESEGLPLSVVRAAERDARAVAPAPEPERVPDDLAAALFLARAALASSDLPQPVPPGHAVALLGLLLAEGLDDAEVLAVLDELPVAAGAVEEVALLLEAAALRDQA